MRVKHKVLANQVIVITGASSGIGLATAYEAAKRGAKVVLSSRNAESLEEVEKKFVQTAARQFPFPPMYRNVTRLRRWLLR